jgi:hypothetical protein
MVETRYAYKILVETLEGKGLLWRRRYRWDDNIKMDLKQNECEGVDWIQLGWNNFQWRDFVNMVMILWVP